MLYYEENKGEYPIFRNEYWRVIMELPLSLSLENAILNTMITGGPKSKDKDDPKRVNP